MTDPEKARSYLGVLRYQRYNREVIQQKYEKHLALIDKRIPSVRSLPLKEALMQMRHECDVAYKTLINQT